MEDLDFTSWKKDSFDESILKLPRQQTLLALLAELQEIEKKNKILLEREEFLASAHATSTFGLGAVAVVLQHLAKQAEELKPITSRSQLEEVLFESVVCKGFEPPPKTKQENVRRIRNKIRCIEQ